MDKHDPWRPRLKRLPLFNPFEPSTQWYAEMGADDPIEIDDEEEAKGNASAGAANSDAK